MYRENSNDKIPVLIAGQSSLIAGVCLCLMQAGHAVTYFGSEKDGDLLRSEINTTTTPAVSCELAELSISDDLSDACDYYLVIALTNEDVVQKKALIARLEKRIPKNATVCINMEGINLSELQDEAMHPDRLVGVNWAEPAQTTFFLEIITNHLTPESTARELYDLAMKGWHKDPYVLKNGYSVRARLFSAMAREAFNLVENGYSSVEDVDRACRNDAGYYLPFTGNFRYMDLMGTYAYGLVMKDLNPDLSNEEHLPVFFNNIINQGGQGMSNGRGFYNYGPGEKENWNQTFTSFSDSISEIIEKYPFKYLNELPEIKKT